MAFFPGLSTEMRTVFGPRPVSFIDRLFYHFGSFIAKAFLDRTEIKKFPRAKAQRRKVKNDKIRRLFYIALAFSEDQGVLVMPLLRFLPLLSFVPQRLL